MKSAAAKDEIELLLISGFRSIERQRQIIEDKLRRGMDLGTILTVNAAPKFTYIRIFIPKDKNLRAESWCPFAAKSQWRLDTIH
jgi:D-alanyl-D-alanine carboxypeptidase